MKSDKITFAVFTGTGNTLVMATLLSEKLRDAGKEVSLISMDNPESLELPKESALGLALPVACFSTYPTVWRFIDAIPAGEGRECFLLATMGGVSLGMEGPLRHAVKAKGYKPIGSAVVVMPSNYNNKTMPEENNKKRIEKASHKVEQYAAALLDEREAIVKWAGGSPLSSFLARMARTNKPWRMFYRAFPLTVNPGKCTGCGICQDICPEGNIKMVKGKALILDNCQSCQRCCGFCPEQAIFVPNKPAMPYRSVDLAELKKLKGA